VSCSESEDQVDSPSDKLFATYTVNPIPDNTTRRRLIRSQTLIPQTSLKIYTRSKSALITGVELSELREISRGIVRPSPKSTRRVLSSSHREPTIRASPGSRRRIDSPTRSQRISPGVDTSPLRASPERGSHYQRPVPKWDLAGMSPRTTLQPSSFPQSPNVGRDFKGISPSRGQHLQRSSHPTPPTPSSVSSCLPRTSLPPSLSRYSLSLRNGKTVLDSFRGYHHHPSFHSRQRCRRSVERQGLLLPYHKLRKQSKTS